MVAVASVFLLRVRVCCSHRSPFLLPLSIGVPRSVSGCAALIARRWPPLQVSKGAPCSVSLGALCHRCASIVSCSHLCRCRGDGRRSVFLLRPSIDTAVMVAALIGGHCQLSPVFCHISGGGIFCKKNAVLLQNLVNNCISKQYVATLKKRDVAGLCKLLIFSCFFATFQNPVLLQTNV